MEEYRAVVGCPACATGALPLPPLHYRTKSVKLSKCALYHLIIETLVEKYAKIEKARDPYIG